jgi:two-component system, NtrC family, response regulator HydG
MLARKEMEGVMAAARILVVDDDADTCASLADLLTDLGYEVDVAGSGPAALRLVPQEAYGLALLDYRMPGMNGVELFRRISQLQPATVGALLTAYAEEDTVRTASAAGVRRVLWKPLRLDELISLIEEVMGTPA